MKPVDYPPVPRNRPYGVIALNQIGQRILVWVSASDADEALRKFHLAAQPLEVGPFVDLVAVEVGRAETSGYELVPVSR